jgi:hypothetical protein
MFGAAGFMPMFMGGRLSGVAAVNVALLREAVDSATDRSDAIMNALDIILHGYPVGLPH